MLLILLLAYFNTVGSIKIFSEIEDNKTYICKEEINHYSLPYEKFYGTFREVYCKYITEQFDIVIDCDDYFNRMGVQVLLWRGKTIPPGWTLYDPITPTNENDSAQILLLIGIFFILALCSICIDKHRSLKE